MNTRDQAGQLISSPTLPPSGTYTTIIGGTGSIPAVMVGSIAVPTK